MWEVRHGAATALREVLKVHGAGAGKLANVAEQEVTYNNLSSCKNCNYQSIFRWQILILLGWKT